MITKTFSTITREVGRTEVWELMSDVNNWKNWDDSIEYSFIEGVFQSGSKFVLKPKGGPKVNIELVEVRPRFYFKDKTVFPLAKMYGEHFYEDTPDGLKLTITMTMTGLLSKLWYAIVMKNIVAGLPEDTKVQIESAKKLVFV